MRTFSVDVLCCPRCSGRLELVALMTEPKKQIRRYPPRGSLVTSRA